MKYPAGQWRGARGAGPAGGSLPEASPTEEGTFCPLCDLTFSLPWARKLSKGPLRTLDSPLPPLAQGVPGNVWRLIALLGEGMHQPSVSPGQGCCCSSHNALGIPETKAHPAPKVSRWNPSALQETGVRSPGQEDPREKQKATTPVFLPGRSHRQRNLVGHSPWGHKGQ